MVFNQLASLRNIQKRAHQELPSEEQSRQEQSRQEQPHQKPLKNNLIKNLIKNLTKHLSRTPSTMATINGITGAQYTPSTINYPIHQYQYASSSFEDENRISPSLIIFPLSIAEITKAIQYARSRKIAIAIRTGGHQYCGASSTTAPNIQLDLSQSFRSPSDRRYFEDDHGQAYVYTSVSWALGEFAKFLKGHKAFVPHGQCVNVHLGGHVQTGGWGQLGRSFGLLGDHVISLEIVDWEGNVREVTRESDSELFFALLGGSPGNFGVITHFTLKVYRDKDYVGSRGVKSIYWYEPKALKRLLDILVTMSEDDDFPRNYDFCISVLSSSNKLLDFFPEIDGKMREQHPEIYGENDLPFWPRLIIVYAQWVPFSKTDVPDKGWFDNVRKGSLFDLPVEVKPMSELASKWLFRNTREFDFPYVKSTHVTNSRTLSKDGWAEWVTDRIDTIVKPEANQCYISAQLQCFGGKNSMFHRNADNGTGYSWRDTTLCVTLDCFYDKEHRNIAEDWHRVNEEEACGPQGKLSKDDRRVLWGSFGSYDLDSLWKSYYEDAGKYERLGATRRRMDPEGTFTPNTFSVARK